MIPDEAIDEAAEMIRLELKNMTIWEVAEAALEAAYPIMLSHEIKQTRLAHQDAMVNRQSANALQEVVDHILTLHQPGTYFGGRVCCTVCRAMEARYGGPVPVLYPCPTVQTIQWLEKEE